MSQPELHPPPRRPERLRADNVTPPARTPWGGGKIVGCYKRRLGLGAGAAVVGEAWEVSVEPSFPSRIARTGQPLSELVAADPAGWLGPVVAARFGGQTPLLVKLLDAAQNLSVQVHPAADDPALAPDESGKPEAWIILDAEPGAGIYLGLREHVTREAVEACLRDGGGLDALLNFVPVQADDVFVVEAGVVHAIGAGVTLVEPQLVIPGKRAVTYRFWDWDRRYDATGCPDPAGRPRELHLERALAVTAWDAPRGAVFVAGCRSAPVVLEAGGGGRLNRTRLARTPWLVAERWRGEGTLILAVDSLVALVCVGGSAEIAAPDGAIMLRCGESAVVPVSATRIEVTGHSTDLIACWVPV